MSPTSGRLSPGFSTVDQAVELIKQDNRQNPVVDMDWLVAHIKWIETAHNFRIPKIRRLSADEVYRTKRGRLKEYETTGEVNCLRERATEKNYPRQVPRVGWPRVSREKLTRFLYRGRRRTRS